MQIEYCPKITSVPVKLLIVPVGPTVQVDSETEQLQYTCILIEGVFK